MDNACAAKIEAMRALLIRDQTEDTRATVECRVEDVAYAFRWVYAITDHGRLACSPEHMMEMGERLMRAHEHITRNAMARNGHRDHFRGELYRIALTVYSHVLVRFGVEMGLSTLKLLCMAILKMVRGTVTAEQVDLSRNVVPKYMRTMFFNERPRPETGNEVQYADVSDSSSVSGPRIDEDPGDEDECAPSSTTSHIYTHCPDADAAVSSSCVLSNLSEEEYGSIKVETLRKQTVYGLLVERKTLKRKREESEAALRLRHRVDMVEAVEQEQADIAAQEAAREAEREAAQQEQQRAEEQEQAEPPAAVRRRRN
ncbi:protein ORF8 [Cyprinid herpesvirus 2]|nr:protein ORF8 [Cyprinid herpesvirus 2]QAU54887.1 protein ORF8 [Cyprinid herpesvirus 2]